MRQSNSINLFVLLIFLQSCTTFAAATTLLNKNSEFRYGQVLSQQQSVYPLLNDVLNQQSVENGMTWYGNWCGSGHGGYQDCCNGTACSKCIHNEPEPNEECLKQCPPIDELDKICSHHDSCTFRFNKPKNFSCSPQGNYCVCDCKLVEGVTDVLCPTYGCEIYWYSLMQLFRHWLACFYNGKNKTSMELPLVFDDLVCDGDVRGRVQLNEFCT